MTARIKNLLAFLLLASMVILLLIVVPVRSGCAAEAQTPCELPSKTKLENLFWATLAYGSPENMIGTFNGWTIWMGWDGSFSENYDPFSETYAWVLYLAPEGIFVALQWAESNYSNVDMYAAYDYFYGVLQSPFGQYLPRSYVNSLNGITLSIDAFDTSLVPVGALSHVSFAISSGQTVFRIGSLKSLQRGIQYSAGLTASFSLLPFSLPFGVSLDYNSGVEAGFYPVILWDIDKNSDENPVDLVIDELEEMSATSDDSFPGFYEREIAQMMIPFMQSLPSSASLREFMDSQNNNSKIDGMLGEVEKWLRTGDTSKLPGGIDMPMPPSEQYANMRPVKTITDECFELAYEHAYKSTSRDDTIYADCMVTEYCTPGDNCTLEVTAEEISELVPGSAPEDFEGIWVGFDLTPEEFLVVESDDGIMWTWIENGVATYEFVNNTDSPFFLGVQVWPEEVTNNKTIELCRRKVVFEETFAVPEVNYDDVETDDDYVDTCIASRILQGTPQHDELALLRDLRDRVLTKTICGRTLTRLYYQLGSDIGRVLEENPALKNHCRQLILQFLPLVKEVLSRDKPAMPDLLSDELKGFLQDLSAVSPADLKRELNKLSLNTACLNDILSN